MKQLFDFMLQRFPAELQNRIFDKIRDQKALNPNDRLQNAAASVLEETLEHFTGDPGLRLSLASLCCYLTPKMRATDEFLVLLRKVDHPYMELFVVYYEERPASYLESLSKIEELAEKLVRLDDFTEEMRAHLLRIESWVHGQQGNISKLKEIYRNCKERLPQTKNLVEQYGLQEAVCNSAWWFLHSGVESNVDEMITFIESFVIEYRLYSTFTQFLNLKGTAEAFFGDNKRALESYAELIETHERFNDQYRLSIALGNAAETYASLGKIVKAKEMMERAIKLYKSSTGQWPYLFLVDMGNLYFLLGDPKAEDSFLQAYEIQKRETSLHKAYILHDVVHFYLRSEKLDKADSYLREFQQLAKDLQIPSVNAQLDYLRGFYERLHHNISNSIKYLYDAIEQAMQTKDLELILFSNTQLAAAHLQQYRLTSDQAALNLALNFLDTVIQLANENKHSQILMLSLMVRMVLHAVNDDLKTAVLDIKRAKEISGEIDNSKWINDLVMIEESITSAEALGSLEIDSQSAIEYLLPRFKTLLSLKPVERKKKESEILGLLIISNKGTPVYSKFIDKLKVDDIVLSGVLMAITHISERVIKREDKKGLERLQEVVYEDLCIAFQAIPNGLVAVIATAITAETRVWASAISKRIHSMSFPEIKGIHREIEEKVSELLQQQGL
ncbi:MAG: hypothetical protein ACFFD4_05630 [Candidatus Odinarchaeota archaeon]